MKSPALIGTAVLIAISGSEAFAQSPMASYDLTSCKLAVPSDSFAGTAFKQLALSGSLKWMGGCVAGDATGAGVLIQTSSNQMLTVSRTFFTI